MEHATVNAHTVQDFDNGIEETRMECRFGQFDMTKVSWALTHLSITACAADVAIHSPHRWVKQTSEFWSPLFHCLWVHNFAY